MVINHLPLQVHQCQQPGSPVCDFFCSLHRSSHKYSEPLQHLGSDQRNTKETSTTHRLIGKKAIERLNMQFESRINYVYKFELYICDIYIYTTLYIYLAYIIDIISIVQSIH